MHDPEIADLLDLLHCENPLCGHQFHRSGTKMDPRRYCSEKCKFDSWVIKRAGELLADLSDEQLLRLIRQR